MNNELAKRKCERKACCRALWLCVLCTPQSCPAQFGEKGEFWAPIPCYGFSLSPPLVHRFPEEVTFAQQVCIIMWRGAIQYAHQEVRQTHNAHLSRRRARFPEKKQIKNANQCCRHLIKTSLLQRLNRHCWSENNQPFKLYIKSLLQLNFYQL